MQNSLLKDEIKEKSYLVLARKYRPLTFNEIMGQDIVVQTLSNFFKNKRIPHALIFTGIRGVGKTTMARIIAKGLNCSGNSNEPTFNPCLKCDDCIAILKSNHSDVLEIDAASHTSVNDIREIIEASKYTPVSSRYKVYIIDEVHMLSNSAFNALLKTLEEPPAHVKFIFATTEIQKIPLTILSRCQKFRLKLLKIDELEFYYRKILEKEGYTIEDTALKLIAKSAKGSIRDGLSVLDQAIVMSDSNKIIESNVKEMLNIADTKSIYDLYEKIIKGEVNNSIKNVQELYSIGIDPVLILENLLEITHNVSKLKVTETENDLKLLPDELDIIKNIATKTPISFLSRLWDMLLQGLQDIKFSNMPLELLEVIIIKIAHVNTYETPEEILKKIQGQGPSVSTNEKKVELTTNKEEHFSSPLKFLNFIQESNEMMLYHLLRNELTILNMKKGHLKIALKNPEIFSVLDFKNKLNKATNIDWSIEIEKNSTKETIAEQHENKISELKEEIKKDNLVKDVLNTFTETEIADIKIFDKNKFN